MSVKSKLKISGKYFLSSAVASRTEKLNYLNPFIFFLPSLRPKIGLIRQNVALLKHNECYQEVVFQRWDGKMFPRLQCITSPPGLEQARFEEGVGSGGGGRDT